MSVCVVRSALAALALIPSLGLVAAAPAEEAALSRGVGRRVPDFRLPDVRGGEPVSLYEFRGKKAAVIVFTGVDCPIGDLYMPRLVRLAERYGPEGVVFLAINSNDRQSASEIAAQADAFGLPFPVLKDAGNVVADRLLAERTCEALVLNAKATLRYRGAIDDQYGLGFAREEPVSPYLADAIEAVLAGEAPETSATSVVGCPIERAEATAEAADLMRLDLPERVTALIAAADRVRPPSAQIEDAWSEVAPDEDALIDEVGPVTYSKAVAPIVQAKCASCHRPGEVGPFPLTNYEEVRRRSAGIQEVVDLRRMPPWHADPRFGHFANDRSLTPIERATVLAWIEQGAPEGDPSDLPEPVDYPDGWIIGVPDLVVAMPEPYTIKAEGFEKYQHIRIPLGLDHDVWVEAGEARPEDREVVHHIIAYIVPPGASRGDREEGHICGYAPGEMPTIYPEGTAKRIPAGSDIELEVHYTPLGSVRTDRSKVGFVFADGPIAREALTVGISNGGIRIPPGADDHPERARLVVPRDMRLLAFMPHMHLRGKSFRYDLTYADGSSETLLDVPAYDFAWQSYYYLAEPIDLKTGEVIDCLATYDNSLNNPVNPDPEAEVRWGAQTWDEMMIGYIDVSFPIAPEDRPAAARVTKGPRTPRIGWTDASVGRYDGADGDRRIGRHDGPPPDPGSDRTPPRSPEGRPRCADAWSPWSCCSPRHRAIGATRGCRRPPSRRSPTWSAPGRARPCRRPTGSGAGPSGTNGPGPSRTAGPWR